jgi:hypothetical protein
VLQAANRQLSSLETHTVLARMNEMLANTPRNDRCR